MRVEGEDRIKDDSQVLIGVIGRFMVPFTNIVITGGRQNVVDGVRETWEMMSQFGA